MPIRPLAVFIASIFLALNCLRIQIATPRVSKPILYSEIPNPVIKNFRIRKTLVFWGSISLSDSFNSQDIIDEQFRETPEAVGIKNFKVRIFDSVWTCGGGAILSSEVVYRPGNCLATGVAALLGFVLKKVEVTGDLYAAQK